MEVNLNSFALVRVLTWRSRSAPTVRSYRGPERRRKSSFEVSYRSDKELQRSRSLVKRFRQFGRARPRN